MLGFLPPMWVTQVAFLAPGLGPDLGLGFVGTWGANQHMEDMFLYHSSFQLNKQFNQLNKKLIQ